MKKLLLLVLAFVSGITQFAYSQCLPLMESQAEPGRGHVGELVYFDVRPQNWTEPIHWTALNLPPGIDSLSDQYMFKFYGSPTQPGTFNYVVTGSTASGCRDTVTITQSYVCFPVGTWNAEPASGNLPVATVGQPYSQPFYISDTGYETTQFTFTVASGSLPPGITLTPVGYSGGLAGTPTTTGSYSFTVETSFGSCVAISRSYTLSVLGGTCETLRVFSDDTGLEYFIGERARIQHYVISGGTPPFTFSAVTLPAGALFYPSGLLQFDPDHTGDYSYTIMVRDSVGCTGTFSHSPTIMCNPVVLGEATFSDLKKGQFFERAVPIAERIYPPFTSFEVEPGKLPAGLTLTADGKITGTPTVYGQFPFVTFSYTGLGGCRGTTFVSFDIKNNAPVKTLYFYSVCAQGDSLRNWKVYNQNNFDVNVSWATIYYMTFEGTFVAKPGDNFFSTPVVGGPNTVRIRWQDENGGTKALVQPANNNLCNPPACVVATAVDFYHQGQQRDGSHVQSDVSNASSVLGAPDANDALAGSSKAFSLGFDGFIIVQLNANLLDSPGKDLTVYEYSPNNPSFSSNPERAQVFASMDGIQWVSLGVTSPGSNCQQTMDTEFDLSGKLPWCRYIKVLDISNRNARVLNANSCSTTSTLAFNATSNGFDLDAITCAGGNNIQTIARQDLAINSTRRSGNPFYPNPAVDIVKVDFSQDSEFIFPEGGEIQLTIIDMSGTAVYQQSHQLDDQWTTVCDVSKLNPGIFMARVNAGGSSKVYKLLKK